MPLEYREDSKVRHVICLSVLYTTDKTADRSEMLKKGEKIG